MGAGRVRAGVGALREVHGVGTWFREEITAFDRPRSYAYLIVRSFPPFNHEGGTLTFTPSGDGTHVDWRSNYTHPPRGRRIAGGNHASVAALELPGDPGRLRQGA
ncbi:hypothetical protein MNVI_00010 [Mycobacterium noviomagense]|uniref:Uncharacterized protein n=1 Tax=Mycobacterium noviomagense TaxID=459858 RepID=A0A7I7P706_9MYCO|nr:hypothetical protein MNVI_00010 [Mycobacterium noviomagense]